MECEIIISLYMILSYYVVCIESHTLCDVLPRSVLLFMIRLPAVALSPQLLSKIDKTEGSGCTVYSRTAAAQSRIKALDQW